MRNMERRQRRRHLELTGKQSADGEKDLKRVDIALIPPVAKSCYRIYNFTYE